MDLFNTLKSQKGLIPENLFYTIQRKKKQYDVQVSGIVPILCKNSTGAVISQWEITGNCASISPEHSNPYLGNFGVGDFDTNTGKFAIEIIANFGTKTAITKLFLNSPLMKDERLTPNTKDVKWKELILNGSENWIIYNKNFYCNVIDRKGVTGAIICSHFHISSVNGMWYANNESSGLKIFQTATNVDSVSGLKAWLKEQYDNGTPVVVWYKLANPTTEEISLQEIKTVSGDMMIDINTQVKPDNMSLTYKSSKLLYMT